MSSPNPATPAVTPASESNSSQLGPFFFIFRPTPSSGPVTVTGFFLPLQWPPPASMPPPRTGSAFVLTEFAEAHTPTLHPVWTTGGLPNTLTPTPVSPVSPPQAPPTPAFATWSAGQAVTTVVSVTPSGEVSVAQSGSQQEQPLPSPPSSRPPPSVSSRETQTTETATPVEVMSWLSAPRSTAAPRSTSASGSTWASPSASASAYASTASAQSRRLGIPAEWMRQAEVQAEAQANRTQPAGQVEGRMGGSVPTRSSTNTPTNTLRRVPTFYRSREGTPVPKGSPGRNVAAKPSMGAISRRREDVDSPTRLLHLLGVGRPTPSSSFRLRDVTDVHEVSQLLSREGVNQPQSAESERIMYPRVLMSSTPARCSRMMANSPGKGNLNRGPGDGYSPEQPSIPFRSEGSIGTIAGVNSVPTLEMSTNASFRPLPSLPYPRTLGRTELDPMGAQTDRTFGRKTSCPPIPSDVDVTNDSQSPALEESQIEPEYPDADMSLGPFYYDMSFLEREPVLGTNDTRLSGSTASPRNGNISPSPVRHMLTQHVPHLYDVDYSFSGEVRRVPHGYVNADDVSLSPPRVVAGQLQFNDWSVPQETETVGSPIPDTPERKDKWHYNSRNENVVPPHQPPLTYHHRSGDGPHSRSRTESLASNNTFDLSSISFSQEAYRANLVPRPKAPLNDFFDTPGFAGRSWADMGDSSGFHTSMMARALNVSVNSTMTHASYHSSGSTVGPVHPSRFYHHYDDAQPTPTPPMNRSHGPGSSRSRHRRSSARQVDLSEEDDADISSHEFDPRTLVPSTQIGYMSSSSSSEADETFADVDVDADQAAQWISGNPFWFQEQEHVWHDDGLTTIMEGDEHGRPTPSPAAGSRLPSLMVTSPSTSGTSTLRPGSTAPF